MNLIGCDNVILAGLDRTTCRGFADLLTHTNLVESNVFFYLGILHFHTIFSCVVVFMYIRDSTFVHMISYPRGSTPVTTQMFKDEYRRYLFSQSSWFWPKMIESTKSMFLTLFWLLHIHMLTTSDHKTKIIYTAIPLCSVNVILWIK